MLYVMNAANNQARLSNNAAIDSYPTSFPDGSRIALASSRHGNYEIYYVNADGTNQTGLTTNAVGRRPSFLGGSETLPPPTRKPSADH